MYLVLVLIFSVTCATICHLYAGAQGLKPVFWGMLGLLFGPLAFPFVYLAARRHKRRIVQRD